MNAYTIFDRRKIDRRPSTVKCFAYTLVALASYVLGEGETKNPHIKVPDVFQRSARLSTFITFDKVHVPTIFNNDDHEGEEDDVSTS